MPALRNEERKKSECINGVIFSMSPAPIYQHSVINGNIFTKIRTGLKGLKKTFMSRQEWRNTGLFLLLSVHWKSII